MVAAEAPRRAARQLGALGLSVAAMQGSRFVTMILVAREVPPEELGLWNLMQPLLLYGAVLTLGVGNGMALGVPLAVGRGDRATADVLTRQALVFVALVTGAAGLLIALGVVAVDAAAPWLAFALLFPAWHLTQLAMLRFRAERRFERLSQVQLLVALAVPLLAVPLTWRLGVLGFVWGQAAAHLVVAGLAFARGGLALERPRREPLAQLVRLGLPIVGSATLYAVVASVDRWVAASLGTVEDVGQLTVPVLVSGGLALIPGVASQYFNPKLAEEYGRSGRLSALRRTARQQLHVAVWPTIAGCAITALVLPEVVGLLAPRYLPGVPVARALLPGVVALSVLGPVANIALVTQRQRQYSTVIAVAGVLHLGFGVLLWRAGLGLVALGVSASIAWTIAVAGALVYGRLLVQREAREAEA